VNGFISAGLACAEGGTVDVAATEERGAIVIRRMAIGTMAVRNKGAKRIGVDVAILADMNGFRLSAKPALYPRAAPNQSFLTQPDLVPRALCLTSSS
jgi:hypothetical protein